MIVSFAALKPFFFHLLLSERVLFIFRVASKLHEMCSHVQLQVFLLNSQLERMKVKIEKWSTWVKGQLSLG